uniref:Discoidin domain-containing protein n=1 Tax=Anopheles dirus TaxID=7168 RepID=A0A182NBA2_9DIPT
MAYNVRQLLWSCCYDWVGWRNDSLGWAGKPVEMVFEFDSVRNFSSMVLHTNNMFSKDVQRCNIN